MPKEMIGARNLGIPYPRKIGDGVREQCYKATDTKLGAAVVIKVLPLVVINC